MAAALIGLLAAAVGAAQPAAAHAAPALDAIATIVDAFRARPIVALDEEHGDERSHRFRVSLMRDPRFARAVDDIVVEFGNSRYQDVVDRFVGGDEVPLDALKRVWQDTTQAHTIWDRPIYEEFFRTARAINAALPPGRRLRVLLGDPSIDWNSVKTREDLLSAKRDRSRHPADVIVRDVLAKGRKALVIYGALHLMRQNPQGPNLIEHVERAGAVKAFVVVTHPFASLHAVGVDPTSWPAPRLASTKGTSLENQMDAVLYLGDASGRSRSLLAASLCDDPAYRRMRADRMTLGGFTNAAGRLADECAEASVARQARPDFSGTWKPTETPPVAPPVKPPDGGPLPPPPPRTTSLTIALSATEMKVERRLDAGGRETIQSSIYKLDGTESVNQAGPIVTRTIAAWEGTGTSLVLSSTVSVDGKALGKLREVYRLENGELIVESTREIPAGTFTGRTAYRKVE